MSVNKVILIGRLGQNPEIRYTSAGAAVANFTIATNESWIDKANVKQERTEWHKIVVWGKLAEICKDNLTKGKQVYLEGRLQTRQWDDKDGQTKYITEVQVQVVEFLGAPDHQKEFAPAPPPQSPRPVVNPKTGKVTPPSPPPYQDKQEFTEDDIPF